MEKAGCQVERVPKSGKSSLRRIRKGDECRLVSIRTSQDGSIAFPRSPDDSEWTTLSVVDALVAVSIDDRDNPRYVRAHLLDGADMRARFDRAYAARRAAGYNIPQGRGVWLALHFKEEADPVAHVGAGAGLENPPLAEVSLESLRKGTQQGADFDEGEQAQPAPASDETLTIPEAKRRIALTIGIDAACARIRSRAEDLRVYAI